MLGSIINGIVNSFCSTWFFDEQSFKFHKRFFPENFKRFRYWTITKPLHIPDYFIKKSYNSTFPSSQGIFLPSIFDVSVIICDILYWKISHLKFSSCSCSFKTAHLHFTIFATSFSCSWHAWLTRMKKYRNYKSHQYFFLLLMTCLARTLSITCQ